MSALNFRAERNYISIAQHQSDKGNNHYVDKTPVLSVVPKRQLMKYYIWLDVNDRPVTKAWPYEDETERMAAEENPPSPDAVLRAGTRQQLIERFALEEDVFS